MEETLTIFWRRSSDSPIERHTGIHTLTPVGVVLWHTKASQTFVPWHNVERIEQTLLMSAIPSHEVHNRRLSTQLHASRLTP